MRKSSLKYFAILMCLWVFLSGCGKDEPEEEPVPTEEPPVVQEISPIDDVEGIDKDSVVNIAELPKEEWPALTWEQVRDFTLVYLPSFRDVYGIPKDKELESGDWEEIKELMFWQLFGQVYKQYIKVGDVYADVEIVEDKKGYGEDWIYFEPTEEYLRSLGPSEIADYFQNFYPKVFGITPTYEEPVLDEEGNQVVDEEGNPVSRTVTVKFGELSEDQLLEMMDIFIEQMF